MWYNKNNSFCRLERAPTFFVPIITPLLLTTAGFLLCPKIVQAVRNSMGSIHSIRNCLLFNSFIHRNSGKVEHSVIIQHIQAFTTLWHLVCHLLVQINADNADIWNNTELPDSL